jgi:hypothetical protein
LAYRPEYLEQTLESLAKLQGLRHFTLYISQDGTDSKVADVVARLGSKILRPRTKNLEHWQRKRVPQLGPDQVRPGQLFCLG